MTHTACHCVCLGMQETIRIGAGSNWKICLSAHLLCWLVCFLTNSSLRSQLFNSKAMSKSRGEPFIYYLIWRDLLPPPRTSPEHSHLQVSVDDVLCVAVVDSRDNLSGQRRTRQSLEQQQFYRWARVKRGHLFSYLSKFGSGFNLLHPPMRHEVVEHFTCGIKQTHTNTLKRAMRHSHHGTDGRIPLM